MGKRDNRAGRNTRELDAVRLAALTKEAKEGTHDQPSAVARAATLAEAASLNEAIALGRTATLDDPFTTGLLAEVARRSQTQEFDEDLIEEIRALTDKKDKKGERKSG